MGSPFFNSRYERLERCQDAESHKSSERKEEGSGSRYRDDNVEVCSLLPGVAHSPF